METNLHHVMHYRRWYKSNAEKMFRNMSGLVLPLNVGVHNDLHATVPPPPKPSRGMIERITNFAHDQYAGDVFEAFDNIVRFVGDVANSSWSSEVADEAFRLHENLALQGRYVELGKGAMDGTRA